MVNSASLGVVYARNSLDEPPLQLFAPAPSTPVLHVSAINRELYEGSFTVVAYAQLAGERRRAVGYESVLSRFNVGKCLNCLAHLEARPSSTSRSGDVAGRGGARALHDRGAP